mmetsp:Transcript_100574/g.262176  ORF Transcript_100574/g.262176 Transcript_100574/m.262176 type:complete len:140 (-) Transcript_100574:219-638(-)
MVVPFSARGSSDAAVASALSAAATVDFGAPAADKLTSSDDDEGDASTADQSSVHASSEDEDSDAAAAGACGPRSHGGRPRRALEAVLVSLPHFEGARWGAHEDCSEDEDAVQHLGQLARRLALGGVAPPGEPPRRRAVR